MNRNSDSRVLASVRVNGDRLLVELWVASGRLEVWNGSEGRRANESEAAEALRLAGLSR